MEYTAVASRSPGAGTASASERALAWARVDYFEPDDYVLGMVRDAVGRGSDVRISHATHGELVVLARRGEYFARFTADPAALFSAPGAQLHARRLTEAELERSFPVGQVGRNIDELLWHAGYHASRGRLMQGCRRDDVVQLRHWPNLTRLPAPPSALRIAALLTRAPTSLTLAAHLLKAPVPELCEFYSAARAAGLAVPVNRPVAVAEALPPHRSRTLLERLIERIGRL